MRSVDNAFYQNIDLNDIKQRNISFIHLYHSDNYFVAFDELYYCFNKWNT